MSSVLRFLIKLNSDAGNVTSVAKRVKEQLEGLQSRAQSVGRQIREALSPSALGSSLMEIPGMKFLANPYTMIGAGIGAITKLGAEAEMTATAFSTLVGNEEKATAVLKDIGEFATSSPFGKLDLIANAQQMLSFGVETDKVMTYLRQLGDISGGDKERLSSLSLVMGQVSASGKLMGQDLMQFINAGFNPLKELQKMHPEKTYEQLSEAMSKGKITADMVASAIQHATAEGGQFYGMMEKTSQTIEGRWSSAMDSLQEMAIGLFEQIRPYVAQMIHLISKSIPYISRALMGLFSVIAGVIRWIKSWWQELALVGSIIGIITLAIHAKSIALGISSVALGVYSAAVGVVNVVTNAWITLQWLLNAAMTANPIGIVVVAIGVLVAAIVYCWNKFAGFRAFIITAWETFKTFGSIIKDYVVNRIQEMLEGIGKVGKALSLLLSGNFSEAWSTFKDGVGNLAGKNSAQEAVVKTRDALGSVRGMWQENLANERAKDAKRATNATKDAITTPELKGSAPVGKLDLSGGGKNGKGNKTASAVATGGSRPTTINITIGKLIERMGVEMHDRTDTRDLERVVLESLNRALAIASSTE